MAKTTPSTASSPLHHLRHHRQQHQQQRRLRCRRHQLRLPHSDHNLINHNGYLYGWTSAISYNNDQWFDNYSGFHNIVSNNIITGEFDGSSNHTDGNGIILDLGGNTPPALIIK